MSSVRLFHYSDIENVYDEPVRAGRLAGLLRERRDDRTILVGTGDTTAPGVLSLVTEGRQSLDFFSRVRPEVSTFGNHDFDHGLDATRAIVRDSPQRWVSANVYHEGARFAAVEGVTPTTVVDRGGARVGFVGVTTPRTPSINPMAADLDLEDPVAAVERGLSSLRERGVDYTVVCSHLGTGDDDLARRTDADVILGGHVHSDRIDRVCGTLLTRPGAGAGTVIEVELGPTPRARRRSITHADPDARLVDSLRERMRKAGLTETVARVEEPIRRTEIEAFGGESRIGNWVADAYRTETGADVALQNAGGIRGGPPLSGEVSVADCVSVLPFDERVAVAEVSGEELLALLAEGYCPDIGFGDPEWWHAHVSGLEMVWDPTSERPKRVRVGGDPLSERETYTLATTDYLFHTDHEFPTLTAEHRESRGKLQYDVLADHAREYGIDPEVEGRLVGI